LDDDGGVVAPLDDNGGVVAPLDDDGGVVAPLDDDGGVVAPLDDDDARLVLHEDSPPSFVEAVGSVTRRFLVSSNVALISSRVL
jgi:hypothetical protein